MVPHNFNPSDALTKTKGAHLQPCLDSLSSGMYHLKTESANLAERAAEKEKTGRKARNKSKFKSPNQPSDREHEPHRGQWFWHFCGFFQLSQRPTETPEDPSRTDMSSEYTFDSEICCDLDKLSMCDISSYDSCDKSGSESDRCSESQAS